MKPLTPEQQAFAEEHHGLLLDFMAKHSLGDDYYDLLANRYLKVVIRYLSEEALRKYSFSTVAWYHLRSELSNYARDQVGKPQEIPIEFYCEIPAPEIAPIDDGLWRVIEDMQIHRPAWRISSRLPNGIWTGSRSSAWHPVRTFRRHEM